MNYFNIRLFFLLACTIVLPLRLMPVESDISVESDFAELDQGQFVTAHRAEASEMDSIDRVLDEFVETSEILPQYTELTGEYRQQLLDQIVETCAKEGIILEMLDIDNAGNANGGFSSRGDGRSSTPGTSHSDQMATNMRMSQSLSKSGWSTERYGGLGSQGMTTLSSRNNFRDIMQQRLYIAKTSYDEYKAASRNNAQNIAEYKESLSGKSVAEILVHAKSLQRRTQQLQNNIIQQQEQLAHLEKEYNSLLLRSGIGENHYLIEHLNDKSAIRLMHAESTLYELKLALAKIEYSQGILRTHLEADVQCIKELNKAYISNGKQKIDQLTLSELKQSLEVLETYIKHLPEVIARISEHKKNHQALLKQYQETLNSWGWRLNPFGESRSSLETKVAHHRSVIKQESLSIAQKRNEQALLLPLLDKYTLNLIAQKEAALQAVKPSVVEDACIDSGAELVNPLVDIRQENNAFYTAVYTMNEDTVKALELLGFDCRNVFDKPFSGSPIQHYVHQQLVVSLDKICAIQQGYPQINQLLKMAVAFNSTGRNLNEEHKIAAALSAKDACDKVIEYAKTIGDVMLAAAEGPIEGVKNTWDTLGQVGLAAANIDIIVSNSFNNAAWAVNKLFTVMRKDFELAWKGDEKSIQEWEERRRVRGEKTDALIEAFGNALLKKYHETPFRDKVKATTRFFTECHLFGRIGGLLFEEAAAVVDMVKLEAEMAGSTIKDILSHPERALAKEVIEFTAQTIDKDAELVKTLIEFAENDIGFLKNVRNSNTSVSKQLVTDFFAEGTKGEELYNFTHTTLARMNDKDRFVPIQILDYVIKNTKGIPDPRGSEALMYYTTMWKNGKTYNLEVLCNHETNTILHFLYTKDPLGPLTKL